MSKTKMLTTLQIDKNTRDMLREISRFYERSMAAQVRSMIREEHSRLRNNHDSLFTNSAKQHHREITQEET